MMLHLYNSNLYKAPIAATQSTLAERLQRVHETASLFYNRMMQYIEYGRQKLEDIVDKEAREKEQETKEQQEEQTEENINLTATEKDERSL